jgi:hypothetical protein
VRSPPPDPDLPPDPAVDSAVRAGEEIQCVKQFLWHGNVLRALQAVDDLAIDLDVDDPGSQQRNLLKALHEFATYIRGNESSIPNYDERYRAGEAISSSLAEPTINHGLSKRIVKKQQMRWSPLGAHLLLQVRTRVLNDDLADDFRRWYPSFSHTPDHEAIAA